MSGINYFYTRFGVCPRYVPNDFMKDIYLLIVL